MKKNKHLGLTIIITFLLVLGFYKYKLDKTSKQLAALEPKITSPLLYDQVHQHLVSEIRLGDGVPMGMDMAIRWKIEDTLKFTQLFPSVDEYYHKIIVPRCFEITSNVSNTYDSVDSVFSSQRQLYIDNIKANLYKKLGEPGIAIKEVIVSNLVFPSSYTSAMEEAGLQRQQLERIKQQKIADLARAEADRERAKANGKIAIARAEADDRLQKIQATTEESKRAIEVAKAKTRSKVETIRTQNEAERNRILADAELERQTQLKNLDIQRQRDLDLLAIQTKKQLKIDELELENQFAQLCSNNPVYASYLVNKELADNVQIAVLPTGTDPSVFSDLLGQRMPKMKPAFQPN